MRKNTLGIVFAVIIFILVSRNLFVECNFLQTAIILLSVMSFIATLFLGRWFISKSRAEYIAGLVVFYATIASFAGIFVYINDSLLNHYIFRQPQPVKIMVTYKGDFFTTLRCSQPTWMIPFYHQVRESPLSNEGSEYYQYQLVFGKYPYHNENYLTYDGKRVMYEIYIGYFINVSNAEDIYKKYGSIDPKIINKNIFDELDPVFVETTRMYTLAELVTDNNQHALKGIDGPIADHMSWSRLKSFHGESAQGYLQSVIIPVSIGKDNN